MTGIRATAKAIARVLATVAVAPALVSYWIRARVLGRDRALAGSTQALSLIPGLPGRYLRAAFLRRVLQECSAEVAIEFGVLFSQAGARIEPHVYVGPGSHLGLVHLERDVLLGAAVHVTSGPATHGIADLTIPIREQPGTPRLVRIGAGSWIGSGSVVMADVGRGTVVAAGAVVTRPLPDRVIAAGVPARIIRARAAAADADRPEALVS